MTDAGRLRNYVQVQQMVESRDETGAVIETPTTVGRVWMAIEPLTSREWFAAGAMQASIDSRGLLRAVDADGITTASQIIDEAQRVYDVRGVRRVDGRDAYVELMLQERV